MRKQRKKSVSSRLYDIVNVTLLLLFTFICVFPFYYMLLYTFSDAELASNLTWYPKGFTLKNYITIFKMEEIFRGTIVSVLRTVIGTVGTVACCAFFGYLVTKERMVGRKFIYRLLIVTMYVDGGLIPTYMIFHAYGMINNYMIYVVPGLLSAYNCILVKTFTEQLPASLEESAMIDGAGPIRSWWSIILPLSKPILATLAVFCAVGQWNSWFDAHIYMWDETRWPLQYILYRYMDKVNQISQMMQEGLNVSEEIMESVPAITLRMTITAVVTIPIMLVYPFMQKYFMKGMLLGAVKG